MNMEGQKKILVDTLKMIARDRGLTIGNACRSDLLSMVSDEASCACIRGYTGVRRICASGEEGVDLRAVHVGRVAKPKRAPKHLRGAYYSECNEDDGSWKKLSQDRGGPSKNSLRYQDHLKLTGFDLPESKASAHVTLQANASALREYEAKPECKFNCSFSDMLMIFLRKFTCSGRASCAANSSAKTSPWCNGSPFKC